MLLLDEEACKKLPEEKQVLHVLQWLQNLPQAIKDARKEELKSSQKQLVTQLQSRLQASLGPPLHFCLGQAFVALYAVGDTLFFHDTLVKCCDVIKTKEDAAAGPSNNKLAAIECLGAVYECHGRMAGSMLPDTIQILVKAMRIQEYRSEILNCFCRLLRGLGPSSTSAHKDVYKCVRNGLTDKSMAVRSAAAKCALELSQHSTFLFSQDLDSITNSCLRALDGSNYDVRCSVAKLLGTLLSLTQKPLPKTLRGKLKLLSLEEALTVLSNGFVRGASGFLKTGGSELLKMGSASREVRVGITQTYVVFLTEMGGVWVERNLSTIAKHVLELVAHPKTTQSHIDAVYARKCVGFIFRSIFGKLLGESAQFVAAKHLCQLITAMLATPTSSLGATQDEGGEQPLEGASGGVAGGGGGGGDKDKKGLNQHAVICSVMEIGALIYSLNTAALPLVTRENSGLIPTETNGKLPPLLSALHLVLLHSSPAVRLAGAWCVHCLGLSLPSQLSCLLDYCMARLHQAKTSPTAKSGYAFAIASLLGTVRYSELGLPTANALEVYRTAQSLLTGAKEEKEHSLNNIQSGWALIGAYISLGPTHVSTQLRSLLSLWRSSFPRSMKELGDEQTGGTLNFWTTAFETRTGALASICSFLVSCGDVVTTDISSRLMLPLDSSLAMLSKLPLLVKLHGVQVKVCGAMLRLRLYQTLSHLPPSTYEGSLNVLLRELVTEISLADNLANTTTTSLLRSMCHHDDSILLGAWLEETDQRSVEEQLQPNSAAGSGALEHDPLCVFMNKCEGMATPEPLPLGVAVIDSAVLLFGRTFPAVASKHRQQLLTHFRECVRQAKGARQQAIQVNIFTAFLAALKNLVEDKAVLGEQDLFKNAYALIASALASSESMLRCAAGEALGRISQVGGDANFMSQIAQGSFDMLKSTRDSIPRMGHSLVLGCLHRYVGGMGSGQHLQTSVRFLHALAKDTSNHLVQVWALHALALIADSGGPMFRNYVELTLSLTFSLLVTTPPSLIEVHQCLGKCLSALLTTLGPELQDTSRSMTTTRNTCLTCCSIIHNHPDAIVQSAAIACSQQLQVFAPRYVSLPDIVPLLCRNLDSSHLLLRRAAANCLRQFTQRDPNTVWNLARMVWHGESPKNGTGTEDCGLEHVVLAKLDSEHDQKLCADLREILFSILTSLAPENPMKWLQLCNGVLAAVNEKSSQGRPEERGTSAHQAEGGGEEMDEDLAKFTTGEEQQPVTKISPRWPTKEFAIECSRKIYNVCKSDPAHFDLSLAQKQKRQKGGDYLVMHLSELVRISFIAATASVDQLKLAGYQALRDVIELFSSTPDPDCPGHSILEQYQAQIGAALRPAFAPDTAPHVTATACQVCSEWLGGSVSGNHGDLKRVQQLLVSSLQKITAERQHTSLYGEAVATMESLAVLNAWAELYIKVSEDLGQQQTASQTGSDEGVDTSTTAMALLDPHLPLLSQYWLAALQDHAHLTLPPQFSRQLPPNGGTFYSNNVAESVKPYFEHNWPSLLHAAAIWLQTTGLEESLKKKEEALPTTLPPLMPEPLLSAPGKVPSAPAPLSDPKRDHFHLVLGLAVQTLCTPTTLDSTVTLLHCLKTLNRLLLADYVQSKISGDPQLATEILHLLHRLLLTCQSHDIHVIVMLIAVLVGQALQREGAGREEERDEMGQESPEEYEKTPMFALLEVSACCLLRLVPDLRDSGPSVVPHSTNKVTSEEMTVASHAVSLLATAMSLCSAKEAENALPTVLHLLLHTVNFASVNQPLSSGLLSSSVRTLQQLTSQLPLSHPTHGHPLSLTLRSALSSLLLDGGGGFGGAGGDAGALLRMESEVKVLVLTVLLRSPSPSVCPPNSQLFVAATQLFRECLFTHDEKVQLKTLQMIRSVFQISNEVVRNPFLHALGPEVVKLVERKAEPVAVVIEALQVLEMLLEMTSDTHKSDMLGLVLPLLISCLSTSSTTTPSPQHQPLHGHALQRLVAIGPKYPTAFKSIMQAAPLLRQQLENAIKASQGVTPQTTVPGGHRESSRAPAQPPSIKLKMDFSNFK